MLRKFEAFLLIILLLCAALFGLNWAIRGLVHSRKDVVVPDLTGRPLLDALTSLSAQNLGLQVEGTEFNDNYPAGTVLRQQPNAGLSVREGKIVRVTISQGGEMAFMPDCSGQSLRTAEISLRNSLLSLGEVRTQPSLKYEKDTVISQDPAARKVVPKNTFVNLIVSDGPPPEGILLMPDFSGKLLSDALNWAKANGIKAEFAQTPSQTAPDTILTQELPPDTPVQPGSSVKFTVAGNQPGNPSPSGELQQQKYFKYEVPQGESAKEYVFKLVDSGGSREIYGGALEPGTKKLIPLPAKFDPNAIVRVYVNGIFTDERNAQ